MIELKHKNCVLVGDIHGETEQLLDEFKANNIDITDSDVIFLGDIGLGFFYFSYHGMDWIRNDDNETLKVLEKWCKKNDNDIWLLRGNHDDPEVFNKFREMNVFDRLHFLDDGDEILGKNGKSYLVVPGAISVDRVYRRLGISYWENEVVNEDVYISKLQRDFDGVFAHTGPTPPLCEKSDFIVRMKENDPALEMDINEERRIVENIIKKFNIKNWYGGHYHVSEVFETINNCEVRILNINQPWILY